MARELPQRIKVLAAEPHNRSHIPEPHLVEGETNCKLSSDLHTALWHMHRPLKHA